MKKSIIYLLLLPLVLIAMSCKEKKESNYIIVRQPVIAHKEKTQKTGDQTQTKEVKWLGTDYKVTTAVKADPSLPLATDGSTKYYDNRITLRIIRPDSTVFFDRTFTKSDFRQYVDDVYYKNGALVAIVFDKVEGNTIKFAATVGNPDKSSDEFMPLELDINNLGALTVKHGTVNEEE